MTQIAALPSSNQAMQFVVTLGHLYLVIVKPLSDPSYLKIYKLRSQIQKWVEVEDLGELIKSFLCMSGTAFLFQDMYLLILG